MAFFQNRKGNNKAIINNKKRQIVITIFNKYSKLKLELKVNPIISVLQKGHKKAYYEEPMYEYQKVYIKRNTFLNSTVQQFFKYSHVAG